MNSFHKLNAKTAKFKAKIIYRVLRSSWDARKANDQRENIFRAKAL